MFSSNNDQDIHVKDIAQEGNIFVSLKTWWLHTWMVLDFQKNDVFVKSNSKDLID